MRKITVILFLAVCFHYGAMAALSQNVRITMTNVDVVELSKAGLDESTIILAIEQSDPGFDTSSKALAELKELGVSPKILEAMRRPKTESQPSPGHILQISKNEVLLIDGEKEIAMKRAHAEDRYIRGDLLFVFFSRSDMVLEGMQSQLRVSDRTPEFLASIPSDMDPAEMLVVVKLKQKSGRREVEISTRSRFASLKDFKKKAIVPTTFEEAGNYSVKDGTRYSIYRVKVKSPLPPGEYAFVPWSYATDYYDFGIDAK